MNNFVGILNPNNCLEFRSWLSGRCLNWVRRRYVCSHGGSKSCCKFARICS